MVTGGQGGIVIGQRIRGSARHESWPRPSGLSLDYSGSSTATSRPLQGNAAPSAALISGIGPPCQPETAWHACEAAIASPQLLRHRLARDDQLRVRYPDGGRNEMTPVIRIIRLGGVNCYLVAAVDCFVLIDSGTPEKRKALDAELEDAGCRPGTLRLIVLTHGDYDHAGNAAYLRDKYDTEIAMHPDDAGRVERADWSWNLKPKPDKFGSCSGSWHSSSGRASSTRSSPTSSSRISRTSRATVWRPPSSISPGTPRAQSEF